MDFLNKIHNDKVLRSRLAKKIVYDCFRNTQLEDFHTGTFPDSKNEDYSDVKVVSPYGEMPWKETSRLSDEEMKSLMIEAVNCTYQLLTKLSSSEGESILEDISKVDPLPDWEEPGL